MSSGTGTPPHKTDGARDRAARTNENPPDHTQAGRGGVREFFSTGPGWITAIAALITAIATAFYGGTQAATGQAPASTPTVTVTAKAPTALAATLGAEGQSNNSPSSPTSTTGSSKTYATSEPFPGCDQSGARWYLTSSMAPQNSCAQDMSVNTNATGYGFATVTSFPHGVPLTASNTVTVTGTIDADYGDSCLGVAEGNATSGYVGVICAGGEWFVKNVDGLGAASAGVGSQLRTGIVTFNPSDSYIVSLTFGSGTGTLTITSSTQGSAAPVAQSFTTGQFTPTAVGYTIGNDTNTSSETVGNFRYTAG